MTTQWQDCACVLRTVCVWVSLMRECNWHDWQPRSAHALQSVHKPVGGWISFFAYELVSIMLECLWQRNDICHVKRNLSQLKVTRHSLRYAPPHFWNQLPISLIQIIYPLSATFIWTCRFNLLHTAITFHHFFTVLLWAQNLPFLKILSSTSDCFCLSDWSHGSRPFTGLICS